MPEWWAWLRNLKQLLLVANRSIRRTLLFSWVTGRFAALPNPFAISSSTQSTHTRMSCTSKVMLPLTTQLSAGPQSRTPWASTSPQSLTWLTAIRGLQILMPSCSIWRRHIVPRPLAKHPKRKAKLTWYMSSWKTQRVPLLVLAMLARIGQSWRSWPGQRWLQSWASLQRWSS